jgi:hypothetical protein
VKAVASAVHLLLRSFDLNRTDAHKAVAWLGGLPLGWTRPGVDLGVAGPLLGSATLPGGGKITWGSALSTSQPRHRPPLRHGHGQGRAEPLGAATTRRHGRAPRAVEWVAPGGCAARPRGSCCLARPANDSLRTAVEPPGGAAGACAGAGRNGSALRLRLRDIAGSPSERPSRIGEDARSTGRRRDG